MAEVIVGVLALQGDFSKHLEAVQLVGAIAKQVRYVHELELCDGLIIPGGESTTIMHHLRAKDFHGPLNVFAAKKPVYGSCAGLILISKEIVLDKMKPFELIDISVERNAFGRQVESFRTDVQLHIGHGKPHAISAIFIRAPRIRRLGEGVQVLAKYNDEPILVQQGHHLGSTFHPELTTDQTIHHHFLNLIKQSKRSRSASQ